ncbi:hypothetical protein PS1_045736 [Malus domestica]
MGKKTSWSLYQGFEFGDGGALWVLHRDSFEPVSAANSEHHLCDSAAAVSERVAILVADSNRRSRRISSSISCWALRRWLNISALALFHRANRTSVGGRF